MECELIFARINAQSNRKESCSKQQNTARLNIYHISSTAFKRKYVLEQAAGNYTLDQDHIRGVFPAIRLKLLDHPLQPFFAGAPIADHDDHHILGLFFSPLGQNHCITFL